MEKRELNNKMIFLLALGAGISVSTLYYAQPMLGIIREDLNENISNVSLIPAIRIRCWRFFPWSFGRSI